MAVSRASSASRSWSQQAAQSSLHSLSIDPNSSPFLANVPLTSVPFARVRNDRFVADARLQKALNVDDQALIERMQAERMKAYLTVRLMASTLSCLTPELERALAATSPAK